MQDILDDIGHATWLPFSVIAARLALATVLGALIGFEREWSKHPAGLRTHILVALAAAAFTIIGIEIVHSSQFEADGSRLDPLRLIEAVTAYLPHARTWLVFGAGTTHNPHELLEILLPATDGSWMTHANHAKATPPDQLVEAAHSLGRAAHASETVSEALRQALDAAQPDDLVLVTGSLFVVAEARAAWTEIHSLPPLPADPEGVY